jgi:hypothetical protein
VGKTRREGERKRTFAAGADEPKRYRASRRLYPSSGDKNGTRRDETGRSGGTIRCEIKALAGNSATCLGFCLRLVTGSIPAASIPRSPASRDMVLVAALEAIRPRLSRLRASLGTLRPPFARTCMTTRQVRAMRARYLTGRHDGSLLVG